MSTHHIRKSLSLPFVYFVPEKKEAATETKTRESKEKNPPLPAILFDKIDGAWEASVLDEEGVSWFQPISAYPGCMKEFCDKIVQKGVYKYSIIFPENQEFILNIGTNSKELAKLFCDIITEDFSQVVPPDTLKSQSEFDLGDFYKMRNWLDLTMCSIQ